MKDFTRRLLIVGGIYYVLFIVGASIAYAAGAARTSDGSTGAGLGIGIVIIFGLLVVGPALVWHLIARGRSSSSELAALRAEVAQLQSRQIA